MTENKKKTTDGSSVDIDRLMYAWERLQKEQESMPFRKRRTCISSVKIVDDGKGHKSVQVNLSDGGKINDIGDKKDVFLSMAPQKQINLGRLASLLEAVRALGFAAVAMGLPPELKRALLHACERCGIPLKVEKKQKQNNNMAIQNKTASKSSSAPASFMSALKEKERSATSSNTRITSPNSLDITVRRLQQQNKDYLENRLRRCENEIKEDFFDQCRKQLPVIAGKRNGNLTIEERKILEFANRCGLASDTNLEKPTPEQIKARSSLILFELPQEFQKKFTERKNRYCSICQAKNKALEVTRTELTHKYHENKNFNISETDMIQSATSLLPSKEKWDQKHLGRFMQNMSSQLKETKTKISAFRQEKRKQIAAHLINTMESFRKDEISSAYQEQQTPAIKHRQSFVQNVLVQDLMKDRQIVH